MVLAVLSLITPLSPPVVAPVPRSVVGAFEQCRWARSRNVGGLRHGRRLHSRVGREKRCGKLSAIVKDIYKDEYTRQPAKRGPCRGTREEMNDPSY